jgi:pyruvate,water dikinase
LADLEADPRLGGKARSLALLARAGLRVPDAFVVTDAVYRALRARGPALPASLDAHALAPLDAAATALRGAPWPAGLEDDLQLRVGGTGAARLAVRSSFAEEDDASALAPGVYDSRLDVAPGDVAAAVRDVLASALAPGAVAYAIARGRPPEEGARAVLIHGFVPGDSAGAAAIDGRGGAAIVSPRHGLVGAGARAAIEAALHALGRLHGAVEVEWVAQGDEVTFLQLRPYRAPAPPRAWPGRDELPPELRDLDWRWDMAHNPLPLSPAQAGLVALVDERCRIGLRQRVLGGYLFAAPGPPPPAALPPQDARPAFDELRARVERELAALGEAPPLEAALELFAAVYQRLYGEIQPAARRARGARPLGGVESMATERARRAQRLAAGDEAATSAYLALFGDEAPVWDVAVPTHREDASALDRVVAWGGGGFPAAAPSRGGSGTLPGSPRESAVALAEDDDWLYARVQAAVRRALLAVGRALVTASALDAADDLFWLPLSLARDIARGTPPPSDARALARRARDAFAAARQDPPPAPSAAGPLLRGAGTGGRALGRAHVHDPSARNPPAPDAVLVARTLLPTELPLLAPAALVVEAGGPLDHVAAQARERGLPAVVGVAGATATIRDGDLLLVDADQGLVVRLQRD